MSKRWIDVLFGTDSGTGGADENADGDEIAARIIQGAGLIPKKGGEPEN